MRWQKNPKSNRKILNPNSAISAEVELLNSASVFYPITPEAACNLNGLRAYLQRGHALANTGTPSGSKLYLRLRLGNR